MKLLNTLYMLILTGELLPVLSYYLFVARMVLLLMHVCAHCKTLFLLWYFNHDYCKEPFLPLHASIFLKEVHDYSKGPLLLLRASILLKRFNLDMYLYT
jgi:hypothetical protein